LDLVLRMSRCRGGIYRLLCRIETKAFGLGEVYRLLSVERLNAAGDATILEYHKVLRHHDATATLVYFIGLHDSRRTSA
ncbi:hypothetical protein, partial [Pseudomonas aeruginosa]|uniref:hypothetical protein n=1 Tax=Pseudomonas aeruginosa TaxID=287 RepID=UPI003CC51BDD